MTDPAATSFSDFAGKLLLFGMAGTVANFFMPAVPIAFVVNVICLWQLWNKALELVRAGAEGFDPIVAAEAMVAFGVLSLVAGLVSVLARLFLGFGDIEALGRGRVDDLIPFVEGLATAGLAPFFAILLRIKVAETATVIDVSDPMASLARAAADLTKQIDAAKEAMESFGAGAGEAGRVTVGLASTMKTEADRWALALQEGEASVKMFGIAAKTGAGGMSDFSDAAARLRAAASDAAMLLEELATLISAVERFVAPGVARP